MITQTCVGECGLGEWHHKTSMHKVTSERVGATSYYGWLVSMYYIYMHIHASVSVNLEACNGPYSGSPNMQLPIERKRSVLIQVSAFQVKLYAINIEQIDCTSINNCLGVDSSGVATGMVCTVQ